MKSEFNLTDWLDPPKITATSNDGCTNTCMLVEADFLVAVFVTVAVSVYMMDVFKENGNNKNLDGSREEDESDGSASEEATVMPHEYSKNCVDVDPSQFAVKALVATDSVVDLDWVSTWGPTIVIVGTIKFKIITVTMF